MKWFRRFCKPPPPRGLKLVMPTGEEVPLIPVYMGRDPVTRIKEWLVDVPQGLRDDSIEVTLDWLPARTSIRVIGMVSVSKWEDE